MNNPQNGGTEVPVEVLQPSALHQLERAMIDTQVATAHQYPRSIAQFKQRAMGMATMDEETAESCMYSRPVGKEQNAQGKWVQKFAEGASIRLAEIVAASYGNIRVASRIIEQTDRYVKVEGIAHDLESNYAAKSEVVESTVKKDGTPYSEGQRNVVAKAALSKAFRDAIFKVVPKAMCKTVYDAAKGIALGKGKTMQQRIAKLQGWLKMLKVDEARVFAALGVQGWADIGEKELETLAGVYTAIKDGEVKPEDAFPEIAKTPKFEGPEAPKAATEPPKTAVTAPNPPQDAPATAQGVQTAPATANATPAPAQEQPQPTAKPTGRANRPTMVGDPPEPADDPGDAELADAGLAPAQPTGQFVPTPGDTDVVASVRLLAHNAGLTEPQLIRFLQANKIARGETTLMEFEQNKRGSKLLSFCKAWEANPGEFVKNIIAANAA